MSCCAVAVPCAYVPHTHPHQCVNGWDVPWGEGGLLRMQVIAARACLFFFLLLQSSSFEIHISRMGELNGFYWGEVLSNIGHWFFT